MIPPPLIPVVPDENLGRDVPVPQDEGARNEAEEREEEIEEEDQADAHAEEEEVEGEEAVINLGAQMPIFQQKILGPNDPERMYLSIEEVEWAQDIKDLAEKMPGLDELTDFQCAQLALLEHDNVEAALKRAVHLQAFRERYGVIDTQEAGHRALKTFIELFPKHWLSFSFNKTDGNYVFIYDMKGFNPKLLNSPEKFKNFMTAIYYVSNGLTTDMTAIRRGAITMAECSGYDFTKNIGSKVYKEFWEELGVNYPIRYHKMKHFNSGVFLNILYSMTKRILPSYIRDVFEVGNHLDDGGTLDQIFLKPSVEESNQRLLDRLTDSLKRRYDHERTFSLKECN